MFNRQLDFNQVTDDIYIGVTPWVRDYKQLKSLGIGLIINMRAERFALPLKGRKIIKTIWRPQTDHSFFPIKPQNLVIPVQEALATIARGEKVYIYCRAGRHRSVCMTAALLIAQGYTPDDAMKLLKSKRGVADPYAKHIHAAILGFADYWQHERQ